MGGISVVMPLYNKVATVERAIRSVLSQRICAEIVVVDDGSTDGSDEVAGRFRRDIVYERQANAGPGVARNRGVSLASNPVIAFLDADDELLPDCLARHLECRALWPDARVSLSPFRAEYEHGESLLERLVDREVEWRVAGRFRFAAGFQYELARGLVGSAVCLDRDLFLEIGGFDPSLACWEIFDLVLRAQLASPWTGVAEDCGVVAHREDSSSQFERTRARMDFRIVQSRNILAHMAEIPAAGRPPLLQIVEGCLRDLLRLGATAEFRALAKRVDPAWCGGDEGRGLRTLLRTPPTLLRTASFVRRTGARWARPLLRRAPRSSA